MRKGSPSVDLDAPPGVSCNWNHAPRSFVESDLCLVLVALLIATLCCAFVERVSVHDGFGWDGVNYANWARDFKNEVFFKKLSPYYVQRILPSAIVGGSLRLLHIPRTETAILTAFSVYAAALMTLIA